MTSIMNTIKKIISFISIILVSLPISGQKFHWEAELNTVPANGFYKINISPEIVSASANNANDIRIYDALDTEIPYILEKEQAVNFSKYFVEYKVITNKNLRRWPYYSRIVIHNPKKNKISNFQLIIRNADVSKRLKLSGSDDASHWYVIKDKYLFRSVYDNNEVSVIKIMQFPTSNYEYYEILIDDWRNNPIQVKKAGYFNTAVEQGKYAKIENPQLSQKDKKKDKQSMIHVVFPSQQLINKIQLRIEGPEFYYRQAEILLKDSSVSKKRKTEYFFRPVKSFIISSNSLNSIYLSDFNTKDFYIRINNKDNQAIKIKEVNAWQLNHYLTAKLQKNKNYFIRTGDKDLYKPEYDLMYFKNEIPKSPKQLSAKKIVNIFKKERTEPKGLQANKMVLWSVIGVIAVLLIYFTTKMIGDMQKKNE